MLAVILHIVGARQEQYMTYRLDTTNQPDSSTSILHQSNGEHYMRSSGNKHYPTTSSTANLLVKSTARNPYNRTRRPDCNSVYLRREKHRPQCRHRLDDCKSTLNSEYLPLQIQSCYSTDEIRLVQCWRSFCISWERVKSNT